MFHYLFLPELTIFLYDRCVFIDMAPCGLGLQVYNKGGACAPSCVHSWLLFKKNLYNNDYTYQYTVYSYFFTVPFIFLINLVNYEALGLTFFICFFRLRSIKYVFYIKFRG